MYKLLPILLFAYGLAVTTEDIYDNSYALIIGIDKYENVRSLDYAVKDAVDIQSMLVDKFHFKEDNIVLLKDEEATQASILQEFSNITKKANDNDRVLIFFAGHGETIDLPDGGEMGFLLPVDGDKTDLYLSAIKMEELRTLSLLSDAKHILYLVDACYGGIVSVGARGLDAESTPNYLQKITQYKSRQIISAGGRGEQVIEKAEWGHSAFTKNLLTGLRDFKADTDSDGIITVQELGTYLKKKVTIDSDNRQTPKTRNLSSDEGEFVFVYAENTAVIKDKSTDAKLDAVLAKLEKLESQKSSDEDIVLEKTVDRENSFFEIGEYEEHGVGFVALAYDWYLIEYIVKLKNNLQVEIGITHLGEKGLKQLFFVSESFSGSINGFNASLIYTYFHKDFIEPWITGGFAYTRIHGGNISDKSSKKFNAIFPTVALGVNLNPYQIKKPIALNIGISMGVTPMYFPTSYESDADGVITLRDWKVTIMPLIGFNFLFPK